MEALDRLSKYFNERDRRKLESKSKESLTGFPEMSVSFSFPFLLVIALLGVLI